MLMKVCSPEMVKTGLKFKYFRLIAGRLFHFTPSERSLRLWKWDLARRAVKGRVGTLVPQAIATWGITGQPPVHVGETRDGVYQLR
jgi:hypothetical protein